MGRSSMSYAIDRRLLRLAGELLAAGPGTFGADDVRRLFRGALEDDALTPAETAAILVAAAAVRPLLKTDAGRLFAEASIGAAQDDPALEPWIAQSISAPLLRRAVFLIAGRGRGHAVTRPDIVELLRVAFDGGPSPAGAISPEEARAILVIRELLDGRLAADALRLLDDFCAAAHEDGYSLGSSPPSRGGTTPPPPTGGAQCRACTGTGSVTCSACGGHGYHMRSGTRTRPDGSTEYYQEHVPCSCTGGRVRCGRCHGSGRN